MGLDEAGNDGSAGSLFFPSVFNQGQGLGIICVASLINGVAITLGENITDLLTDNFGLKKTEVALTTFVGVCSCVVSQLFGVILDAKGYRPVASVFAAIAVAS